MYGAGTGNGTRLVAVAKKAFYNNEIGFFLGFFSPFFVGDRMFFFRKWCRKRLAKGKNESFQVSGKDIYWSIEIVIRKEGLHG